MEGNIAEDVVWGKACAAIVLRCVNKTEIRKGNTGQDQLRVAVCFLKI